MKHFGQRLPDQQQTFPCTQTSAIAYLRHITQTQSRWRCNTTIIYDSYGINQKSLRFGTEPVKINLATIMTKCSIGEPQSGSVAAISRSCGKVVALCKQRLLLLLLTNYTCQYNVCRRFHTINKCEILKWFWSRQCRVRVQYCRLRNISKARSLHGINSSKVYCNTLQ